MTHPRKEIQGYAEFIERVTGNAKDLWKSLEHESLLDSYDEYQDFLQGRKKLPSLGSETERNFQNLSQQKQWQKLSEKKECPIWACT